MKKRLKNLQKISIPVRIIKCDNFDNIDDEIKYLENRLSDKTLNCGAMHMYIKRHHLPKTISDETYNWWRNWVEPLPAENFTDEHIATMFDECKKSELMEKRQKFDGILK